MHLTLSLMLCLPLILIFDKAPVVSSTYVPSERCNCPKVMGHTPGRPLDFSIREKNIHCQAVEILVKVQRHDKLLCLSPSSRQGRRLLKCWRRLSKKGKDTKQCLRTQKNRKNRQKGRNQKGAKSSA